MLARRRAYPIQQLRTEKFGFVRVLGQVQIVLSIQLHGIRESLSLLAGEQLCQSAPRVTSMIGACNGSINIKANVGRSELCCFPSSNAGLRRVAEAELIRSAPIEYPLESLHEHSIF